MRLSPMIAAALAAAMASGPAAALSCLPHDLARTFERVNSAAETYVAFNGTLEFDESLLPEVDMADQQATPKETRIPARISGEALSRVGFNRPFAGPVTLIVECFGPWCAQPPAVGEVLAFLRQDPEGFTLTTDPCGGDAFFGPDAAMLDKAHRCFTGGECEVEEPQ
ncbi:hypothetical protein [Roseovarius aquimarinus]|uniref:Lipoprotein n=1 Tax=Roseovarius aquimarinus TaxID=1229156 RepID=A0ABW7I7F1_9RHOB